MLKKLFNKEQVKNEKGLSLIELLAVIVILAIISAIAIPAIGNILDNSRYNAVKADGIHVLKAAKKYFIEEPTQTKVTVETLLDEKYLDSAGMIPVNEYSYVTKIDNQVKLKTGVFLYTHSYDKLLVFDDATISDINNDQSKGSDNTAKRIPAK